MFSEDQRDAIMIDSEFKPEDGDEVIEGEQMLPKDIVFKATMLLDTLQVFAIEITGLEPRDSVIMTLMHQTQPEKIWRDLCNSKAVQKIIADAKEQREQGGI
jgi:hypothetical protein